MRLNASTSITVTDKQLNSRFVWQQVSDPVGQSERRADRRPGRPISESDSKPAGLHQSVQVISASVVRGRQNQVLLCRTRSTSLGLKPQQWFLNLFKNYLKNIKYDSWFAYTMFSTFFKLSYGSLGPGLRIQNKYTPRNAFVSPQLSGPADDLYRNRTTWFIS